MRERYLELRADEAGLERDARRGRRARPRDRRAGDRRRARRHGRRAAAVQRLAARLSADVAGDARPRPRGLPGPVRPAPDARAEGGDRPARGRPRRGRARLRRAPRARRRARPRGGHRVPGADRRAARAEVAADAARRRTRRASTSSPRRRPRSCSRGCSSTTATAAPPQHLRERLEAEHGFRYRSAPLPPELRRVSLEAAEAAYDPERLAEALGGLLEIPPPLDLRHVRRPAVSVEQRLAHLRELLAAGSRFSFDEAVQGQRPADRGGHAVRPARALQGGRGEVGAGGAVRPDHGGAARA